MFINRKGTKSDEEYCSLVEIGAITLQPFCSCRKLLVSRAHFGSSRLPATSRTLEVEVNDTTFPGSPTETSVCYPAQGSQSET